MVKQRLEEDLKKVITDLDFQPTDPDKIGADTLLSISPNPSFGDYSTNIALQLAKQKQWEGKQSSLEIANQIVEKLKSLDFARDNLSEIKVAAPGFINFFIKPEILVANVKEILDLGDGFSKSDLGKGQKIEVEFISANPTGPLTLANGRGGALGDTLANVLQASGYDVDREYYLNDTGNQIRMLGESTLAAAGKLPPKEEYYQGEYIKELAEKFKDDLVSETEPLTLGHKLANYLLEHDIKPAILRLGVNFDEFYSERSIYERGLIEKTIGLLEEKAVTYEKDGALWLKSSEFGDEKDRVLLTSEKERGRREPTYMLPDIAHHQDVLARGYVKRINILGADHHGYEKRLEAALAALGLADRMEIIFIQLVKLFREGKEVRMSKRTGTFVTLDELLDAVGKDAVRFFFLMYAPQSHIDFNLDLAKEKSNKNPVFYVQYAHARMSNILAKSQISNLKSQIESIKYELLNTKEELELIKHLSELPDLIKETAKTYQVQALPTFALKLADSFHRFYESSRVLNAESEDLQQARIALVTASQIVLVNTLRLMGISAPERM